MPIGEWVLRRACIEAAAWPDDTVVAVNLSPAQFRRAESCGDGRGRRWRTPACPPRRLEIEITENVLLTDAEDNLAIVPAAEGSSASRSRSTISAPATPR